MNQQSGTDAARRDAGLTARWDSRAGRTSSTPLLSRRGFIGSALAMGALGVPLSPARAAGGEKLTVILDWLLNVNHAALFAAQECGAFTRAGLDVELVSPSDPDSPARLVTAGQADVALGYGTQINLLVDQGLPLVRFGTLIDRPINVVAAMGNGSVRTLADLKGRRVGLSVSGVEESLLAAMLHSAGLSISDVTVTKVNYQMVTALLTGRIDAAIGAYRNAEVLEIEHTSGIAPVIFAPEDHGVPLYDELIMLTRQDLRADPRIPRFISAVAEGRAALLAHPDDMRRAFVARHTEQDTPVLEKAWAMTSGWIPENPGHLDTARYETFEKFCLAYGVISKLAPLDSFATETRT
ncbi:ABC transporter substrate-binding protein [Komagataeibacter rhaeticus]|uniref:ABC transporter substrate-binding protein n=2 Tax=Komagataeibacter rhaeticus TaxID=215221 RepID=A0A858JL57_9PROT|nr:ABC transporter substrate-binding protein [Komagataeibacter rhaeticus]ATU72805.1 thiamine biosynthesis protein [Komagataeibacter xylinus]QIP35389.1 ABC transporter substrate-binding protein [Komagataeibacter rhaeticus]QOC47957.1 ABC transporter substrate-binding protein [Komagataeibacter rhaeticus]